VFHSHAPLFSDKYKGSMTFLQQKKLPAAAKITDPAKL
jgi:hypothetical protein